jgi:hypothetical protein
MWRGFILAGTCAMAVLGCGASLQGGQGGQGGGGECSESALCLNVKFGRPGTLPAAQLVVIWVTPGVDAPPEVAYQAPFTGQETTLRIDLRQLTAPSERALYPAVQCDANGIDCRANPTATAYVLVVADSGDGTASLDDRMYGAAPVMVGFATFPIERGERALSDVFPDGMREGFGLYTPLRPDGRMFDQLWPAARGAVFELRVCPPDGAGQCDPPVPNIT